MPKLNSRDVLRAQRWAACCKSRAWGQAGCPGSSSSMSVEILLRITVSSLLKSCARTAANRQAWSTLVNRSTPQHIPAAPETAVSKSGNLPRIKDLELRKNLSPALGSRIEPIGVFRTNENL